MCTTRGALLLECGAQLLCLPALLVELSLKLFELCQGTVLSCTRSACCRGYKRGERGRKAPKSLLEEGLNVANRDAGA